MGVYDVVDPERSGMSDKKLTYVIAYGVRTIDLQAGY